MPLEVLPLAVQEIVFQYLDLGSLLRTRAAANRFWKQQFDQELKARARAILANPEQHAPRHHSEHYELFFSMEITHNALPLHHLNRQNLARHAVSSFSQFLGFRGHLGISAAALSRDLERYGKVNADHFTAEIVHERTNLLT